MSLHPFEQKGLGQPPFILLAVHQHDQKSATCANCGQRIKWENVIQDVSGKRISVGSECVLKSVDPSLYQALRAEKQRLIEAETEARIKSLVAHPAIQAKLDTLPSPEPFFAAQGQTLRQWLDFMIANSGRNGKRRIVIELDSIRRHAQQKPTAK